MATTKGMIGAAVAAALLLFPACSRKEEDVRTAAATPTAEETATPEVRPTPKANEPIFAREPDRYTETISIIIKTAVAPEPNAEPAPLEFEFAKAGGDRKATFRLPGVGPVAYLEHAGLKYIVVPSRRQYVEVNAQTGVEMPQLSLLTPSAIVEHLKSSARYENIGAEEVDGRRAIKYRFTGQLTPSKETGTVKTDSIVYLDEITGLPVRAEIIGVSPSGAGSRIHMEMRDVRMNPDPAEFEVPIGFNKVGPQQLKQQVAGLASILRVVVAALSQQITAMG